MNRNNRTVQTTADGSSTLLSSKYNAHYHSLNGAITESKHIFIEAGLGHVKKKLIKILEIGFGTGLNAALTAQKAKESRVDISYHSVELHPLSADEYSILNYDTVLPKDTAVDWQRICVAGWNTTAIITENFTIRKICADFTKWTPIAMYHLIYFDAFAPDDQPEMWTREQFQKLYNALHPNGVLVTYSAKGIVKRALIEVGFTIERLAGPPGKIHILRANKI